MTSPRLRSLARRLRPGAERRRQLEQRLDRCGDELSQREGELSEAHAELAEVRSELTRAERRLERARAMRAMVDAPGAMPRAVLPPAVQDRLRSAGFRNTGGTKKGDPRAYASFVAKLFEVRRYTYAASARADSRSDTTGRGCGRPVCRTPSCSRRTGAPAAAG